LLGSRILEDACQQLVLWQRNFPSMAHLTMSVNVSRKQLSSPNLAEQVIEIVRRTQVSPKQLKLEITESAMMENAHGAIEVLQQLRAADIQLQMDDFGTGYSSLSCLQNFPLQGLKIDRTFMGNVSNEAGDKILNAITTLAHGLKMPLVAEGVETQDQFEHLQALGCDYAQGYLFARPMDSDATTAFLMGIAASVSRAA
ncbi:MAG: EAL domain-containing protein, partial [Tepidisphaeraceae bacterium]